MIKPEYLLRPAPEGLYCPPGTFFIDPVRPVDRALVTPCYADPARPVNAKVIASVFVPFIFRPMRPKRSVNESRLA